MAILHVVPENDQTAHEIDKDAACACQPSVTEEGKDSKGWECRTVIHKFSGVTEDGVPMRVKKVTLDAVSGEVLTVEAPSNRQVYGARVRTQRR